MNKKVSETMLRSLLALSTTVALSACGKSESTDDASTISTTTTATGTTTTTGTATEVNALASAYPGSLALSVFPEDASSGLRLAGAGSTPDETGADRPPEEKMKEAEQRMKGEGDCFDIHQLGEFKARFNSLKCYEFDSDMNPHRLASDSADRYGTVNGLDGLPNSTQACLVTFTKSQVDEVVHNVDRSLAMVQGLVCVEKKIADTEGRDVRKPTADGDPVSLTEAINAKLPANSPIKFTKADVSAVTNDDDTLTYITEIAVTNPEGKTDSITLRHIPAAEGGTSESGILSYLREPKGGAAQQNDPNVSNEKYAVMTIQYTKSNDGTTDNMKAELTRAMINKKYEPLDENGLVNFAAVPAQAQNSDIHAINSVSFDINPSTGAGSLSYWMNPGGNLGESARGLVFNLTADGTTGLLSGCGTSGATSNVSIRAAAADDTKVLSPTRYWHPQGGQNVSPNKDVRYTGSEGNKITQQCVKQAADGSYGIDTAKTTHALGYDVIAGSDSSVRAPARPPEAKLPPPPPKP